MAPPIRRARVNILHGPIADRHAEQAIREIEKRLQDLSDKHDSVVRTQGTLSAAIATLATSQDHLAVQTAANAAAMRRTTTTTGGGGGGGGGTTPDDGGAGAAGCGAAGADGHVTGTTLDIVGQIVCGTGHEFPALLAVAVDQPTRDANTAELLGRIIWHLQLAGFAAGKQQNPSGLVSGDKITVQVAGVWWAYDVFSLNPFDVPMTTHMVVIGSPNTVADAGIAD